MKIRMLIGLIALVVFLMMGLFTTHAIGPADNDPLDAPYLDGQPHSIAARSATWYRFEFLTENPAWFCRFIPCPDRDVFHGSIVIRMPGAARNGLTFAIYASGQIGRWHDAEPVGRGNVENGDLVWAGTADGSSVWYLRVINNTNNPLDYAFIVNGERLITRGPTVQPTPTMSFLERYELERKPTPTPTSIPSGFLPSEPGKAVAYDNQTHAIPARSEWWYIVSFPLGRDRLTLKLLGGARSNLRFDVYTPDQLNQWWMRDPLGRGNSEANDLVWTGERDGIEKRYIRIINSNDRAVEFRLLVDTYEPVPAPRPFEFR